MNIEDVKRISEEIVNNIEKVIIGKHETVEKIVLALLCGGHILLEDVPGSGKTMLAKTLARSVAGEYKRIQLTPDLLPADITGINYFNMKTSEFQFVKGPVFSNILIADEINRATPKTQAGLLECMEEKQVTVDTQTYKLLDVFMVIATQNPIDTQGVFPLPEAQIDRFLMKLDMSYPEHKDLVNILKEHSTATPINNIESVTDVDTLMEIQKLIQAVNVHEDLYTYVADILEASRIHEGVIMGISQRGGLALIKASKTYAAMNGRNYVLPDDIKYTAHGVLTHRLILKNSERVKKGSGKAIIDEILDKATVPTEVIYN